MRRFEVYPKTAVRESVGGVPLLQGGGGEREREGGGGGEARARAHCSLCSLDAQIPTQHRCPGCMMGGRCEQTPLIPSSGERRTRRQEAAHPEIVLKPSAHLTEDAEERILVWRRMDATDTDAVCRNGLADLGEHFASLHKEAGFTSS